ncbi:MAG: DUF3048 domain-containing protein [Lachnospiraceae bacterium]|nr:DUF3048 domain-containing protein [Lachnospiraceae bacterium]
MSKKAIIAIIISAIVVIGGGTAAYFLLKPAEVKEDVVYVDPHANEAKSILTGQWMDKAIAAQRPIAVMNENDKTNQPLFGLNHAGVIYECPVEGSYTRLMPIYDNNIANDMKIGNVRSCRPYYVFLAHEFDAIYVNWGQSIYAKDLLLSNYIDNISGVLEPALDTVVFYTTNDHPSPNNKYTNRDLILKGVAQKGYRTLLEENHKSKFTFAEDDQPNMLAVEGATDCAVIKPYFFFNLPWFEYDATTQKYKRFQFKGPMLDGVDNSQIEVDNVIFQNVDSHDLEVGDTAGSPYIEVQTMGSGTGKYFTKGKMIDITWVRKDENDVAKYYDPQGNEIVMNQGKTWVCLTENKYVSKNKYYATIEEFNAAK